VTHWQPARISLPWQYEGDEWYARNGKIIRIRPIRADVCEIHPDDFTALNFPPEIGFAPLINTEFLILD
jgi:hypothetical protein